MPAARWPSTRLLRVRQQARCRTPATPRSQSASARGARRPECRLRPDCSAAAATICRQWRDALLAALSPSGSGALRAVTSGWIAVAPSSVALRIAESIASLATMPCASVSASGDSRSTGTKRSHAHRRAALVDVHERGRVLAARAVEERHRVADGKAQHARRVVRGAGVELDRSPASSGASGVGHRNRGAAMRSSCVSARLRRR